MEIEVELAVADEERDWVEDDERPRGRNTPSPWRPSETTKVAVSRAGSINRLPPPLGVGWNSLFKEVRDVGGMMQPSAIPDLVEKEATGMLDLRDRYDGDAWRTVWLGESSKRQGCFEASAEFAVDRDGAAEDCFQGSGRYAPTKTGFCPEV